MITPTSIEPRSYGLPASVTSNIPAVAGPRERGVFAAARGLLIEAATLLEARPTRLHVQDNRGTFADGHVDITIYATLALDLEQPAGQVLLSLAWGLGSDRTYWTMTMDRYAAPEGHNLLDHRHLGSADGCLPAPVDLALLIVEAG